MTEKGYEKVTVQDILDRTETGRATFYQHFRSKEDLLDSGIKQLRVMLLQEWRSANESGRSAPGRLGFTAAFFKHVDDHRSLYRSLAGREGGVVVDHKMRRMLAELVRDELKPAKLTGQEKIAAELAVQYVVGALSSVLKWWLDYRVPLSPDEINTLFQSLTFPALDAMPGGSVLGTATGWVRY